MNIQYFCGSDRLSDEFKTTFNLMKTIPVTDVAKQKEEEYQDQIENLNIQLADALDERNAALMSEADAILQKENYKWEAEKSKKNLLEALNIRDAASGNVKHLKELLDQQDAIIKDLKQKMDFEATAFASQISSVTEGYNQRLAREINQFQVESDSRKKDIDHLARQCVRLDAENTHLKTDNCTLADENKKLNKQIDLYKKDESRRNELINMYHQINLSRVLIIDLLTNVVEKFRKWPCFWWDKKERANILSESQARLDIEYKLIEKARKECYGSLGIPQQPTTTKPI